MVKERRAAGPPFASLLAALLLPVLACAGPRLPAGPSPRVGQVYCLRGLMDVFSLGLNDLADQLQVEGVRATAMSGSRWRSLAAELSAQGTGFCDVPIVLVGHSYGADNAVRVSRQLEQAGVDIGLLMLLDATSPPPIPSNVKRCVHLYKPTAIGEAFPALFAGDPVVLADGNDRTELVNANLAEGSCGPQAAIVNHFNIDSGTAIHQAVIREVLSICPTRPSSDALRAFGASTSRPSADGASPGAQP